MPDIIINPDDWQLKTAAEGGLRSSARNGLGEQPATQTVNVRSQLLHEGDPFLAIIEEPPHHFAGVHHHSEPEVMVILRGKLLLNGVWCLPGGIIYYAANRHYWHSTGKDGCVMGLMRPRDRGYVWMAEHADAGARDDGSIPAAVP